MPNNWSELAKRLGLTPDAVTKIRKRDPDHPPLEDLAAWDIYMASRQSTRSPIADEEKLNDDRVRQAKAKTRIMEANAAEAESEKKLRDGKLMDIEEARFGLNKIMDELFTALDQALCQEFPPLLAGLDEVEHAAEGRKLNEQLKKTLRARFAVLAKEEK